MSFLYPYTISITRPTGAMTAGPDGAVQATQTIVAEVPASIQVKRDKGYSKPMGFTMASNTSAPMPLIEMYLPAAAGIAQGAIHADDMVTDLQSGDQYKVDVANWQPTGWFLGCTPYQPHA